MLPAIIVEKYIIRQSANMFTSDYLREHYVSDLTESEKWTLLAFLLMLEKKNKSVGYLEIGVYSGSTIRFLQENTRAVFFTGVDLFEDFIQSVDNTHMWKNYSLKTVFDSLDYSRSLLEKGRSSEILAKMRPSGKKFDFIFIDGNHTYSATKEDFTLSLPLLRENGFVAFHNCSPGSTQEDKYYLKLDGGPWLLTTELMLNKDFRLMQETGRIKVFQYISARS